MVTSITSAAGAAYKLQQHSFQKKYNRVKIKTTCRKQIIDSKSEHKQKQEQRVEGTEY